ncbi:hypothetical protein HPB50_016963 [Hyalomma asiaticum]|uniref:Uncharacterized protein n=1 Tax=Hyalomma asiaticum TaxID=266040 RepID=A0ACB7RWZ9_HYAAI|nr:hypothetical protein HPB50_016963 [Hyalomma asiaticum]
MVVGEADAWRLDRQYSQRRRGEFDEGPRSGVGAGVFRLLHTWSRGGAPQVARCSDGYSSVRRFPWNGSGAVAGGSPMVGLGCTSQGSRDT